MTCKEIRLAKIVFLCPFYGFAIRKLDINLEILRKLYQSITLKPALWLSFAKIREWPNDVGKYVRLYKSSETLSLQSTVHAISVIEIVLDTDTDGDFYIYILFFILIIHCLKCKWLL